MQELENDPSLEPDPDWDDSVVALLNYPEVIELLNEDIDWTWRLGEAVVAQQADVVAAVETFRDQAYVAGNLKSDSYQKVSRDDGVIEITPVAEDVIYVPYYEPARVVVYQPRPVYYYYPRPCPVYYYPYAASYAFDRGYFWGVTTAFSIGWYSDRLSVFHHSYAGHPYYNRPYWNRWWYRRPTINVHATTYVNNDTRVTINRFDRDHYDRGDLWRPRSNRRDYVGDRRVTRNRENPAARFRGQSDRASQSVRGSNATVARKAPSNTLRRDNARNERIREPIAFRERTQSSATRPAASDDTRKRQAPSPRRDGDNAAANKDTANASREVRQTRRIVPAERREQRAAVMTKQRRAATPTNTQRTEPSYQGRHATPPSPRAESAQQATRAAPAVKESRPASRPTRSNAESQREPRAERRSSTAEAKSGNAAKTARRSKSRD